MTTIFLLMEVIEKNQFFCTRMKELFIVDFLINRLFILNMRVIKNNMYYYILLSWLERIKKNQLLFF